MKFKYRAACEGTDTEQWFTVSKDYANADLLRRICKGCPARSECLQYALENKVDGFWAGTTYTQRKKIRRQRGIVGKPVLPEWEKRSA